MPVTRRQRNHLRKTPNNIAWTLKARAGTNPIP